MLPHEDLRQSTMSRNQNRTDVKVMTELYELVGLFPDVITEGFSALKSSQSVSANLQIETFGISDPFFSSSSFNATQGEYTVPTSGIYQMQATLNYNTAAAITATLGADINPALEIRRTSTPAATLAAGQFPIVNLNLDLGLVQLTIRAVLGSGSTTAYGLMNLDMGDVLQLYYNADGMTVPLTLINIGWSIYRIA